MRVGELLVAAGALSDDQLDEALRAQVMWGGRLGTNLVELDLLDLDTLSTALGRQAGLPAALDAHFQRGDRELQRLLTPDVAERFQCIPLVRAGKRIVIATSRPLGARGVAFVADDFAIEPGLIVWSIAAELRIHYQLERLYQIPRKQRFLRAKNPTSNSQLFRLQPTVDPALDLEPPPREVEPVDGVEQAPPSDDATWLLDELVDEAPPAPPPEEPGRERRTYVKTLAAVLKVRAATDPGHGDGPDSSAAPQPAPDPASIGFEPALVGDALGHSLDDALHAIHRAPDREQLARLVIGAVARFLPEVRSALLMVVRGATAVSWIGFCRDGTDLPPMAVPLDRPGLFPTAIRRKEIVRNAAGDLGTLDYMLLASLGVPYGDLIVYPIAIADHVMSLIAIAAERSVSVERAPAIGAAAGVAFARLMRDAARPSP